VDVHTKKMQLLFGGRCKAITTKTNIPDILADINARANAYAEYLTSNLLLDDEVNKVVMQMK
jgi:hypothetical protein